VATVLDTITRLTDDGVAPFDRAVGRMFRRAEVREEQAVLRDASAVNDKVRLLAKLGTALIEATQAGTDWFIATVAITASSRAAGVQCRTSLPEGLARDLSPPTLQRCDTIPTVCETASTRELSGGNNRATTRSLNFWPYRAVFLVQRPHGC
jgi:hypothetical protein